MSQDHVPTVKRKEEHIEICLDKQVGAEGITTGLENYRFIHNALPELNFQDINTTVHCFGKQMKMPLFVSSMTGGTERTYEINRQLAMVAEHNGWGLALGSMRAALENEQLAYSFKLRKEAPSVPIIVNLGLVQLNYGVTVEQCLRVVQMTEADALVFHLNSLQEVFQPEGDTNFSALLLKLEQICRMADFPVGVKEVGWGIDGEVASRLKRAGVSFIDVAGAGGTSWSQVEKYRTNSPIHYAAAQSFANWGLSTADSIIAVKKELDQQYVFASGGIRNGVDAAKALALGADLVGFGRVLLQNALTAVSGVDIKLKQQFDIIEYELKVAMFGIGAGHIEELQQTKRLQHIRSLS